MKDAKHIVNLIFRVLVLVLVVVWIGIVFIDYFNTRNDKPLKFCLSEKTHKYADGKTYECVGLGYRMFKYDRKAITAKEFGPIFIKERQSYEGPENN